MIMEESGPQLIMNWRSVMMAMVVAPTVLCGTILLLRRVEARAARPLGLALVLVALSMGPQIIGFAGAYVVWPWITFFPLFHVDLWLGPLLVLHAHALTRSSPFGWRLWLLLPGLVQSLYMTGAFLLPGDGMFDHRGKWAFNDAVHLPYVIPVESVLSVGLLGFALVYLWRERRRYRDWLDRNSSALRRFDPVWLRNLALAVAVTALIHLGLEISQAWFDLSYDAVFPFQVGLVCVLLWLGLDAAWRLTVPFPKMGAPDPAQPANGGSPDALDGLAERIAARMTAEQWHLEPRLSVRDVAARMGTTESYVSRAMNRTSGRSFNAAVNALRVDHAKTLLRESRAPVLSVAMDSGFNSKATFNRVFREVTGETPSRFRASQKA